MERLWSPWRLTYVTGTSRECDCIFCDAAAGPDSPLVVHRGARCFVILNLYPYNNGHLMVVPARHIATLAEATPEELAEAIALTRVAEMALTECYAPHGINVGINLGKAAGAGVIGHLHVHLVPRWNGDTNFMTVVGEVRVLPEDLAQTAERLRPLFARLSGAPGPAA
jgi:ATP adenylyltransferase